MCFKSQKWKEHAIEKYLTTILPRKQTIWSVVLRTSLKIDSSLEHGNWTTIKSLTPRNEIVIKIKGGTGCPRRIKKELSWIRGLK